MKATGIVRRIDDLGRIVIPKEIRKILKIREGEELEFYTENNEIILKKFSLIDDIKYVSNKIIESFGNIIGKTILVCDREFFIAGTGNLKKYYLNKSISSDIDSVIRNRSFIRSKDISNINLVGEQKDKFSYLICPILSFGDSIGAIIILSEKNDINEFDLTITNIIANFLGKYVEE